MPVKIAYLGGGSLFVPSTVHGLGRVLQRDNERFAVELALYDIVPAKAERMRAYVELVRRTWQVPLFAAVPATRQEALEGAHIVIASPWLEEAHARLDRLMERLGFQLPEEGPAVAGWALASAPWCLEVAAEMRSLCPDALFVTLMNPTDVLAGVVQACGGVQAAGLCVEVDGLRGALAHYYRVPYEEIELDFAGVNHDGWVLGLRVNGRDCYAEWRARWHEAESTAYFHPGNLGIRPILELTGHFRSSAYHNWPYQVEPPPDREARWAPWRGKRERYQIALERALLEGKPIADPPHVHPERSSLNYPYTGLTVARLVESIATGRTNVLPLQVLNRGAVANFPPDVIVEVPTRVQGRTLTPLPVGELPDWLGGYTRLLAIQRRLVVEYVANRRLETLRQALAVLPMFATVQQLLQYAEALHREFSTSG